MAKTKKRRIWLKVVAWVLGVPISLVILAVAVNWVTGIRAWNRVLADLEAKGQPVRLADCCAEPLDPEIEYFAEHPLLQAQMHFVADPETGELTFDDPGTVALLDAISLPVVEGRSEGAAHVPSRRHTDFYQAAYAFDAEAPEGKDPAIVVAEVLSQFDEQLLALQGAAELPAGHLGPYYDVNEQAELRCPHMTRFIGIARVSNLRAAAQLKLGRPDLAYREVSVPLRLAEVVGQDPVILSQMVEVTILIIAIGSIWEGLADRDWHEPQLLALDQEFARLRRHERLIGALKGEAIFFATTMDNTSAEILRFAQADFAGGKLVSYVGALPHNKANYVRSLYEFVIDPLEKGDWRRYRNSPVPPKIAEFGFAQIPNWMFASPSFSAYAKVISKATWIDFNLRAARVAIAAERYFNSNGEYPESAQQLLDGYLDEIPADPMTGEALSYSRVGDRYKIWSVGWDLVDDGGESALMASKPAISVTRGDWVWDYEPLPDQN